MATTEELLTTLVNLKKEEMKRARIHRTVKFAFGTLPVFFLVLITIYATWIFAQQGAQLMDQLPGIVQGTIQDQLTF